MGLATVAAWLDYNGNGTFDPSEGVIATVASKTTASTVNLAWGGIPSVLPNGALMYMRIRVTYASNNMTTANPTGYFNSGEVEDYVVSVTGSVLALQAYNFNVQLAANNSVNLQWMMSEESNIASYTIEKSGNGKDW